MARGAKLGWATRLTLGRCALALLICPALLFGADILAACLVVVAAVTDWLDGWVARRLGEVSALGATLDPIADKLLTTAVLLCVVANGTVEGVALIAVLAILMREVFVAGLREAAGQNVLPVTSLAKTKTAAQFFALVLLCLGPSAIGLAALWVAAGLTVLTGTRYGVSWWATMR